MRRSERISIHSSSLIFKSKKLHRIKALRCSKDRSVRRSVPARRVPVVRPEPKKKNIPLIINNVNATSIWVITINEDFAPRYPRVAWPASESPPKGGVGKPQSRSSDKIRSELVPLTLSFSLVLKQHASILCDYAKMRSVPASRPR